MRHARSRRTTSAAPAHAMSRAESNWRNYGEGGYRSAADEAIATRPTSPVTRNTMATPDASDRQCGVHGRALNNRSEAAKPSRTRTVRWTSTRPSGGGDHRMNNRDSEATTPTARNGTVSRTARSIRASAPGAAAITGRSSGVQPAPTRCASLPVLHTQGRSRSRRSGGPSLPRQSRLIPSRGRGREQGHPRTCTTR